MYLPLAFKGDGMRCLIIGGGEVALRKLNFLAAAGCTITVVAPHINREIQDALATHCVQWITREYAAGDCRGYQLVIAATERREINQKIAEEAYALCIPINVVDDPELCTVIFPAVCRQGPLTLSVSTEGVAPFMAAAVRDHLSVQCESLSRWVETAARFRIAVRSDIHDWREKNRLYRQFAEAIKSAHPPNPPDSTKLSDWIAWLETPGKDASGE
jgi:uroporphyrin-III C-methyltransferase/precorrin-2 dehydrogenase/sirohydrochlorin ferrochelatase